MTTILTVYAQHRSGDWRPTHCEVICADCGPLRRHTGRYGSAVVTHDTELEALQAGEEHRRVCR